MLCTNCGDMLEDGAVFCTKCGQRVIQESVTEATAEVAGQVREAATEAAVQQQKPVTEEKEAATGTVNLSKETVTPSANQTQDTVTQSAFTSQSDNYISRESVIEAEATPLKQSKKPSKKFWIIGAVTVVLVAVLAIVAVNFQSFANSVKMLTMSPKEYYSYIEIQQLQENTSAMVSNYDRTLEVYGNESGQGLEYGLDVEFGELVCEAISSSLGIEDVSGLSKMGLDFKFATKEDVCSGEIAARLGDTSLISLNALAQLEDGMIYMQLPELTDKFIGIDVSAEMDELVEVFAEYGNLIEAYPEGAVLEDVMNRYMTIAINSFEDVKETKDVVTVGEYEEKCTVLCATMTEPEMYTMLENILKEAKDDKDLQNMLVGFAAYMEGTDEQELRNSFVEAIDAYLQNAELYRNQADANNYFSMSIMVNKKGEVIGRKFEVNKQDFLVSYMKPQKKDAFGYELKVGSIDTYIIVEGEGIKNASEMSGEFLVKMDSMDQGQFNIATLVLENMDMKKWEEGLLDVTCRIKPDTELYKELGAGAAGVFLAGYELVYEADTEKDQSHVGLSVVNGAELIFKFMVSMKVGQYEVMETPADSILYETDEDLLAWMQTMDFDKFMENISQSGMPAELVEIIEEYVDELSVILSYDQL